jgi:hypothetical protein
MLVGGSSNIHTKVGTRTCPNRPGAAYDAVGIQVHGENWKFRFYPLSILCYRPKTYRYRNTSRCTVSIE